jgi:proteasome accessory factor B
MKLTRIHRLLQLIGLLQAGRGYNVEALARQCGVSRRTIFRDLDVLRESGVPLHFDDAQQRYRIPGTYYLPPTNLTTEEALALIVLSHEMGDEQGVPFFSAARTAAIKLESSLPGRLREQLRHLVSAVQIHAPPGNPLQQHERVYQQLIDAIAQRRCVRIAYQSLAEGECIRTRLSAYRLFFNRRSWYVIGRSSLHRATRTFNLGRITELELLDDTYDVPRGFSLQRSLRNAWNMIPEPGPDVNVLIRFSPKVARNVAEVAWHRTQRLEFRDDGSLLFRATVSGIHEISWWILGYGDQAEVLRPTQLRELVAARVRRMSELYQDD